MSEDFFEEVKKKKEVKKRSSYNIEKKILDDFNKICKINNYNKSQIINNFLKKFVEKELTLI